MRIPALLCTVLSLPNKFCCVLRCYLRAPSIKFNPEFILLFQFILSYCYSGSRPTSANEEHHFTFINKCFWTTALLTQIRCLHRNTKNKQQHDVQNGDASLCPSVTHPACLRGILKVESKTTRIVFGNGNMF